jgi:hypothetical protein
LIAKLIRAKLTKGRQPTQETWEMVRFDTIPMHDDLSGETIVADKRRCNIM